ncbi:MAG: agmatinase [Pseudomonadota bacterium]|nr:agmatinase [Pseudomonadota bacterium]
MSSLKLRPPKRAFLGADSGACRPRDARAVIIPFPYEATVSYGGGTARGPEAIIAASPELEFFDDELWREPYRDFGIATLETPKIRRTVKGALGQLAGLVGAVMEAGKFPLVLGGEHGLTPGAIRPVVERYPDLAVLHLDAHADLRDGYQGEPFSHAAALRRVLDHAGVTLVSVGIRNISAGEVPFYEANRHRISIHWARERAKWNMAEIVRPLRGKKIYVTFDVDGFDASLMPATGTPEPGGFFWDEACAVLRAAASAGTVIAADVVELAPVKGLHACDFVAAKLVYKILSYALSDRSAP